MLLNPLYNIEKKNQPRGVIERDVYKGGMDLDVSHNELTAKSLSILGHVIAELKGLRSVDMSHWEEQLDLASLAVTSKKSAKQVKFNEIKKKSDVLEQSFTKLCTQLEQEYGNAGGTLVSLNFKGIQGRLSGGEWRDGRA